METLKIIKGSIALYEEEMNWIFSKYYPYPPDEQKEYVKELILKKEALEDLIKIIKEEKGLK